MDERKLTNLVRDRSPESVERLLAAAREELGMEVAYVAHFEDGRWVDEMHGGDSASLAIARGEAIALEQSICHRVVRGLAPPSSPIRAGSERP